MKEYVLVVDDEQSPSMSGGDEASVPQSMLLTATDEASRIAFLFSNSGQGIKCYQAFSNGEVVSSSGNCK